MAPGFKQTVRFLPLDIHESYECKLNKVMHEVFYDLQCKGLYTSSSIHFVKQALEGSGN